MKWTKYDWIGSEISILNLHAPMLVNLLRNLLSKWSTNGQRLVALCYLSENVDLSIDCAWLSFSNGHHSIYKMEIDLCVKIKWNFFLFSSKIFD